MGLSGRAKQKKRLNRAAFSVLNRRGWLLLAVPKLSPVADKGCFEGFHPDGLEVEDRLLCQDTDLLEVADQNLLANPLTRISAMASADYASQGYVVEFFVYFQVFYGYVLFHFFKSLSVFLYIISLLAYF